VTSLAGLGWDYYSKTCHGRVLGKGDGWLVGCYCSVLLFFFPSFFNAIHTIMLTVIGSTTLAWWLLLIWGTPLLRVQFWISKWWRFWYGKGLEDLWMNLFCGHLIGNLRHQLAFVRSISFHRSANATSGYYFKPT